MKRANRYIGSELDAQHMAETGHVAEPGKCAECEAEQAESPSPPRLTYTPLEREAMLSMMQHTADLFYKLAQSAGHHQFIEFAGFMNEYIKICRSAHEQNIDFGTASVLPIQDYQAAYIGEKFDCIFGESFRQNPKLISEFVKAAFGLVEV